MADYTTEKHIMPSIGEDLSKYDLSKDFQWTCPCCDEVVECHRECDIEDCEKCDEPTYHDEFGYCTCIGCCSSIEWKKLQYDEDFCGYACKECRDD
jgi:hypothetical protein